MKIAFVISDVFSLGGAQRVTTVVSNILKNHGYDVTIINSKPKTAIDYNLYELNEDVKIISLKKRNLFYRFLNIPCKICRVINTKTNLLKKFTKFKKFIYYNHDKFIQKQLIQMINQEDYQIVVGVEGIDYIPLAIIKDQIHAKVIGWQHSSTEAYFKSKGLFYYNQDDILSHYLKKLDAYVVLTERDKKEIDTLYSINSTVIHNPKSFISKQVSKLDKTNFIAVGRLEKIKGYEMLIDIFYLFSKENKDWNLKIVGAGSEYKNLQKQIKKYGLNHRISLVPFTKNVKSELLDASVFLSTSRIEGFSMATLEAFEVGLPIIGFDLPCHTELIHGNGIMIKRFEIESYVCAMLDIIKDQNKLKQMGALSKQIVNEFNFDKVFDVWKKLFDEV